MGGAGGGAEVSTRSKTKNAQVATVDVALPKCRYLSHGVCYAPRINIDETDDLTKTNHTCSRNGVNPKLAVVKSVAVRTSQ